MNYSDQLKNKIINYYENYYRSCGLPDYKERAERRLSEEDKEVGRMERLQYLLNVKFNSSQKHLIVGAGTGGLAVALSNNYGCAVYGVEPCEEEMDIIRGKCLENGLDVNNFKQEYGERMSFADNQFDIVHCFTVIEHVKDIRTCIKEMIRVTKPNGFVYIHTPNYWYPIEDHYKIIFPTFLPKFLGYLYLILMRRPYRFLRSINFIKPKDLDRILNKEEGICWWRIYEPLQKKKGFKSLFFNFIKFKLFVYPYQEIVIKKLK